MELNKSLNDSTQQIVSSKYCPELQHRTKEVNVRKAPGNCCEDSGYYSLSNPEHCEVYASNASYAKKTFHEDKTMKANEHNEEMVHQKISTHSTPDNSELISRGIVVSTPSGHESLVRQYSYNHVHHPASTELDDNANHIHHQKTTGHDFCTSRVSNYYTTVSNVNSNNNDKVIPCQSTGCNCTNNTNHQNLVKPYENEGMGCTSNETQSDYLDLAEKIEFCLVFGYTVAQIRHAIFKLGYKASKNDILAELTSMQNIRPPSGTDSISTSSDCKSHENGLVRLGEFISHGAEPDVDSDFLHNHERLLALGDDDKENEAQMEADNDTKNLRPIVIDGSNVAISHGNKQYFSCKGILLAVNYFRNRHHSDITVFVPAYRKEASRHEVPIKDREILLELERERIVVFTPSRNINGKRVTCYDDRFILKLAQETEAVVVSNDNFRDLLNEKQEWKELVEKRLLMYTFVNDRFMPPDDPLGRNGPNIDNFLRKRPASEEQSKPQCPYGRKCTYGKKCKYFHPECPRTISEKLVGKKSDNGRKKSKQVEAIAKKWIKQQHQAPSTSSVVTSREEVSQNDASAHFTCAYTGGMHTGKPNSSTTTCDSKQVLTGIHQNISPSCGDGGCLHSRIIPQRLPSHEAIQSPPYNISDDNLLHSFRQLSIPSQPQRSPGSNCCCGHTDPQLCYEVRCQRKPFDDSRFHPHPMGHVIPEQSPPRLHVGSSYPKRPYQLSSPANMQSKAMLNHYWKVPNPYHHSTHFQTQYGVHPYSLRIVDPHFSSNHAQPPVSQSMMTSYPMSSHSQVSHGVHSNGIGSHAYVPSVNPSTGSNNSLSRSFPYLPVSDRLTDHPSHLGSASSHSDPRGYSFHVSSGYSANGLRKPVAAHAGPIRVRAASASPHGPLEPSLNNESNPRYHLYRNLCGLYPPEVVGTIMKAHPDVNDPSKIIKLISQFR